MDATVWGQVVFGVGVGTAAIIFSISHLFRTMTSSYGGIIDTQQKQIATLTTQNQGQQEQIDTLRKQHEECEEKHKVAQQELEKLKGDVAEVKQQVNGK